MHFVINDKSWTLKFDNFSYFQNVIRNKLSLLMLNSATLCLCQTLKVWWNRRKTNQKVSFVEVVRESAFCFLSAKAVFIQAWYWWKIFINNFVGEQKKGHSAHLSDLNMVETALKSLVKQRVNLNEVQG